MKQVWLGGHDCELFARRPPLITPLILGGLTSAGNGFSSCDLNHDALPPVEPPEQVKVSMSTLLRQRRKTPILGTKPEQQMQCEDISKNLSKIWIMKL